jgi:hypothetical protein
MSTHNVHHHVNSVAINNYMPTMKIPIAIRVNSRTITVNAMIDSGATSCFINPRLIKQYWLLIVKKEKLGEIYVVDGRSIASGKLTYEFNGTLIIGTLHQKYTFEITDIGKHDVILGMT